MRSVHADKSMLRSTHSQSDEQHCIVTQAWQMEETYTNQSSEFLCFFHHFMSTIQYGTNLKCKEVTPTLIEIEDIVDSNVHTTPRTCKSLIHEIRCHLQHHRSHIRVGLHNSRCCQVRETRHGYDACSIASRVEAAFGVEVLRNDATAPSLMISNACGLLTHRGGLYCEGDAPRSTAAFITLSNVPSRTTQSSNGPIWLADRHFLYALLKPSSRVFAHFCSTSWSKLLSQAFTRGLNKQTEGYKIVLPSSKDL